MRRMLKVLNPLVWAVNMGTYLAHPEGQRGLSRYEPYDVGRDLRYF